MVQKINLSNKYKRKIIIINSIIFAISFVLTIFLSIKWVQYFFNGATYENEFLWLFIGSWVNISLWLIYYFLFRLNKIKNNIYYNIKKIIKNK